ncbi:transposase [Chryseobacterium sp. G0201]|uniref:transposase n=1 Tax=Chryseobacterium sp. G0201 TaxID=2487065 RepID=UPI001E4CAD52|nr:transposase [Chryseobacterium sp. G0201]
MGSIKLGYALYDKMHEKLTQNKAYHRRLVKRRSSTVEPVLGILINFFNMKRINSRGMAQTNKYILMSGLSYNLKKVLKFVTRKFNQNVQIMNLPKGNFGFYFKVKNTSNISWN